ncbi:MAG: beta-lactamase family protein [Acetobacteraceae bacterium]|nr:beta-lactamase family protein [Acetobacteraceae bacterium]
MERATLLAAGAAAAALAAGAVWLLPSPPGWVRAPDWARGSQWAGALSNLCLVPQTSADHSPLAADFGSFDRTMRDWVAANRVTAASLAVMRDNRLVLARGYGERRAGDRVPVWGLSKAITAACVASLVDEGRLGFDDRIGPLLTSFFQRAGPPADERLAGVTVGQLLSQHSGLRGPGPWGEFVPGVSALLARTRPERLRVDMVAPAVAAMRLQAGPGERFEYSHVNYLLLGEIIEAKAGKPYADACRERVLDRAGIANADLAPRWGALTWAAGGWALSGPEYLAFARLLYPQRPDPLGPVSRAWLNDPEGKWANAGHTHAATLGVYLHREPDGSANFRAGGSWYWHQKNAAGGPIDEQSGATFFTRPDGTAVFASFEGLSSDRDRSALAMRDLDRALGQDARAVTAWPGRDLFGAFGIPSSLNTVQTGR